MSVVYELENRGKRNFIISLEDHVSGGDVKVGADGKPRNVYFAPDKMIEVTEECGIRLSEGWKNEIKVIKKTNRKG
jgi:pyridoxine 5'-phosphate synthase PdxJ